MARRFISIRGLMGVILLLAVGCAALARPTRLWAGLVIGATLAVLGASTIGAIYRRGPRRDFWTGFALFGWGSLILHQGPWISDRFVPILPTTALLELAYAAFHRADDRATAGPPARLAPTSFQDLELTPLPDPTSAMGHFQPVSPTTRVASPREVWAAWVRMDAGVGHRVHVTRLGGQVVRCAWSFLLIGHGLVILLSAYAGGAIASRIAADSNPGREHGTGP